MSVNYLLQKKKKVSTKFVQKFVKQTTQQYKQFTKRDRNSFS